MQTAATITQQPEIAQISSAGSLRETGPLHDEARELTGSQILCEALIREGVELLFGYPGGAIMPFYDALTSYPALHHVLVRHEQGAAHAADGYARATGKVGVCVATSGPGATNLVTGLPRLTWTPPQLWPSPDRWLVPLSGAMRFRRPTFLE